MPQDFSTLDSQAACDAGTTIPIISPATAEPMVDDEDGQPVTITILGIDSAKLRKVAKDNINRRVNSFRKGKDAEFDIDEADAQKFKLYAAATIAWHGIALDSKEPLECNEANAFRFYSDPRFPWLIEQIDKAIADRQRFFKKASQR